MTALNDLCELIVDCEHKTAPIQEEGYPSIRTPNIGRGYFLLDGVNRVSEETYAEWTKRAIPQGGDLILAREAPVGNVAVIPSGHQYCLGQRTVLIRPAREKINPDYLCYLLLTPQMQGQLLGKSAGATVHHLNMKDIRTLPIPDLPSLQEQVRASSVIKAYDDLIATNQRRIALLEGAARRLYREWFVHLRFPGHESVPVKDGVPEGWAEALVGVFGRIETGKTPTTSNLGFFGGDIPFIKTPDMHGKMVTSWAEQTLSVMGSESQKGKLLPANSVMVSCIGTIGVVSINGRPSHTNQQINSVIPHKHYNRAYLYFALSDLKEYMLGLGGGSTMANISKSKFAGMPIIKPNDDVLEAFEENVTAWISQIENLSLVNAKLIKARDLLLPKLMSGQLDVSGIPLPEEVTA